MSQALPSRAAQVCVAAGALLIGALVAFGALSIPSAAGYAGVGPNFLPWVVALALLACGGWLLVEALSGGFRHLEPPSGAERGDWTALAWMAAGLLANAALIERIGFVLACALCYTLAVRGLRGGEGKATSMRQTLIDAITGIVIAAPVYALFTKLLGVNLPGLTGTGWI
jgi:putative tricarboxylic transport membrane protein